VVPNVESEKAAGPVNQADEFVFERSDFDNLLNPAEGAPQKLEDRGSLYTSSDDPLAMPAMEPAATGALHTQQEEVPAVAPPPVAPAIPSVIPAEVVAQPAGIFLSPAKAVLLGVAIFVLIVLAFLGGLWLGVSLKPSSGGQSSEHAPRYPCSIARMCKSVCPALAEASG
jgi:hypothetical protein